MLVQILIGIGGLATLCLWAAFGAKLFIRADDANQNKEGMEGILLTALVIFIFVALFLGIIGIIVKTAILMFPT